jgi:hypothetical protein
MQKVEHRWERLPRHEGHEEKFQQACRGMLSVCPNLTKNIVIPAGIAGIQKPWMVIFIDVLKAIKIFKRFGWGCKPDRHR